MKTAFIAPAFPIPPTHLKKRLRKQEAGVTLIELTVVLLVLIALAGVVVPYVGGTAQSSMCSTTDVTLANIRDAILGTGATSGFKNELGMMPSYDGMPTPPPYKDGILSELYHNPAYIDVVTPANNSTSYAAYNPTTRHGWNGPYLTGGFNCTTLPSGLNLSVCCQTQSAPVGNFALDSFVTTNAINRTPNYSLCSDGVTPASDPIELRQDSVTSIYFLVSGGPNGQIDTVRTGTCTSTSTSTCTPSLATRNSCNQFCEDDDRVLVLNAPDPGKNQPCSR